MPTLAQAARAQLTETILPFWASLRDERNGGFYGWAGPDLTVDREAVKGCILNSRVLWFFSEAALTLGRDDLRELAGHAYRFLRDHCVDRAHGGVYWSVGAAGNPVDTTKHSYNQAFALYALSAYYRLTGSEEARALAGGLFHLLETRCSDEIGVREAFTAGWTPVPNEKLSENGVLASRTMNTLLHVFEGCAGYYQATRDPAAARAMRRLLAIYLQKIYDPARRRQRVFLNDRYEELIDLTSYGHDIESSWLLDWGCALLGDPALAETVAAAGASLADHVYEEGYRGGSVVNENEAGRVDEARVWWVQAESVVGFLHQWERRPEETRFRDAALSVFRYILRALVDPRPGGEWFWRADADGRPDLGRPIVEPWKCPYHNGRMCLELIRRDPHVEL